MIIDQEIEDPGYTEGGVNMTENQTQPQTPKAYILSFDYRRTGMGGFSDVIIVSFRTRRPVKNMLHTSRSGNHGTRSYRLFPGKYLAYEVQRSNGGNLYGFVKVIRLNTDGQVEIEKEWEIVRGKEQLLQLDDLPQNIKDILLENKDELPLFQYVFLRNIQEGV